MFFNYKIYLLTIIKFEFILALKRVTDFTGISFDLCLFCFFDSYFIFGGKVCLDFLKVI